MAYILSASCALKYCPWSSSSSSSTSSPCHRGSSSSSLVAITISPVSTWSMKTRYCHPVYIGRSLTRVFVPKRGEGIVSCKAAEIDEAIVAGEETFSDDDDEIFLPLDKLPVDAKLHQRLERKMKMKLTKKIRLRRKKLMHKRRLRKKGQWPPSKMK